MYYFKEEGGFIEYDGTRSLKGLTIDECELLISYYEDLLKYLEENNNMLEHGRFTGYGKNACGPVTNENFYFDISSFIIARGTYYGVGQYEKISDFRVQSIKKYLEKIKRIYNREKSIQSVKKLIFK